MKKMKRLLLLSIIFIGILKIDAQVRKDSSTSFVFTFKQGDSKWNSYKTSTDRIAALQIPSNLLYNIPSGELLEICLEFPYTSDVAAFNCFEMGMETIKMKFNGWKELFKRGDFINVLTSKFRETPFERLDEFSENDIDKGRVLFSDYLITTILNMPAIRKQMNNSQKEQVLQIAQTKTERLSEISDFSNSINIEAIKRLHESLSMDLGNITIGEVIGDYQIVGRLTPKGSTVYAGQLIGSDINAYMKAFYRNEAEYNYGALYVSEATRQYNCHAYAWHISQGHANDYVWIGNGYDSISAKQRENIYWEDSSYIEVPEAIATHISYDEVSADHSAVKYDSSRYISKWGAWPLVIHLPNEVPYDTSQPKKYYIRNNLSISGSSALCDSNDYSVTNLPSGASASWNMTIDGDSTAAQLSVDTPAINQCQISRTGPQYLSFTATLTATIIYENDTIAVLCKEINAPALSLPIPYVIINTQTDLGTGGMVGSFNNINLNPNVMYYLNSLYFNGKTPSLQVSPINGNYMFTPADSNGYHVMVPQGGSVIAVFSDGCTTTNWIFWGRNSAYLMSIGGGDGQLIVDITKNDSAVSEVTDTQIKEEMPVSLGNLEWTFEVYEASVFRKVKTVDVKGSSYTLDTSSLSKGIYIIRAIVGKEILSEKITIK